MILFNVYFPFIQKRITIVDGLFNIIVPSDRSENGGPLLSAWQRHVQQLPQAARAQHGVVDELEPIGGRDDVHVSPSLQAVQLRHQLVHHALAADATTALVVRPALT